MITRMVLLIWKANVFTGEIIEGQRISERPGGLVILEY